MARHTPATVELIDHMVELQMQMKRRFGSDGQIDQTEHAMLRTGAAIKCGLLQLDEARKDVVSILDTFRSDLPQRKRSHRETQNMIAWEWSQVNEGYGPGTQPQLAATG